MRMGGLVSGVVSALLITVFLGATGPGAPTPTEPPKPRGKPKAINLRSMHQYELVIDVLPVGNLGDCIATFGKLYGLKMAGGELSEGAERNGHKTQRVKVTANAIIGRTIHLEREISFAGVGSIWFVSAVDKGDTPLGSWG